MKNWSMGRKTVLWFSITLILIVTISFFMVLYISNQVVQKTVRSTLIGTVDANIDNIEYFSSFSEVSFVGESDSYMLWGDGFIMVHEGFLTRVNEVSTALYDSGHTLMYGENPISTETGSLPFNDLAVQQKEIGGVLYYIFDRKLTAEGLDGLWLRGVVSHMQGSSDMQTITELSLIVLPVLVFLAIMGAIMINRTAVKPVQQISDAAQQISRGDDLKKRIEMKSGKDEIHQLAASFNEMMERLDRSFTAERRFISDISHDLKTPISVIMAECEYALEQERTGEEYCKSLSVICRQGKKMTRLTADMLDYIQLETKAEKNTSRVDIGRLVRTVCEDMAILRENNITLTCEAPDGIAVLCDSGQISRLLTNLIDNAYRYGKEGGSTHVTLKDNGESVCLSVADDGMGIEPQEKEKIFDRFYRGEQARNSPGTGLGLCIVQEIAKIHNGSVSVQSNPGEGSTFTVVLPKK